MRASIASMAARFSGVASIELSACRKARGGGGGHGRVSAHDTGTRSQTRAHLLAKLLAQRQRNRVAGLNHAAGDGPLARVRALDGHNLEHPPVAGRPG